MTELNVLQSFECNLDPEHRGGVAGEAKFYKVATQKERGDMIPKGEKLTLPFDNQRVQAMIRGDVLELVDSTAWFDYLKKKR